jgi:hypothetical protein
MVEEARKRLAEGKFEAKVNPFGDGHAAARCVDAMMSRFARGR